MYVHVSRLRARTIKAHKCASLSAGVYVRVLGQPHAQEHARTHTCTCIRYERMETLHIWDPCAVGPQAFRSASAFNANIGAWNVLRVANCQDAFYSVGLADCIKRGVYDNWGSLVRTAYPTWSSMSAVCATPTPSSAAPLTATPRYCERACVRVRVCVYPSMRTVLAD